MQLGSVDGKRLILINISDILPNPLQPRRSFDEYELVSLSESIKQNGLLQPISVRKNGEKYELIAGERRLKAAGMAGLTKIPCILQRADREKAAFYTIIENLQRCDLTMFEEAEGINRLMECCGLSRLETAAQLGIAQSTLSNKLRLLRLSDEQRNRITASRLTERHARALLRLPEDKRNDALDYIIAKGLTLTETEEYVEKLLTPKSPDEHIPKRKTAVGDVRIFANSLNRIVKTMVLSGVNAKTELRETDSFLEYKVLIRKDSDSEEDPNGQLRLLSL